MGVEEQDDSDKQVDEDKFEDDNDDKEREDRAGTPLSVKEAVKIAQENNFMGLICSSRILVR